MLVRVKGNLEVSNSQLHRTEHQAMVAAPYRKVHKNLSLKQTSAPLLTHRKVAHPSRHWADGGRRDRSKRLVVYGIAPRECAKISTTYSIKLPVNAAVKSLQHSRNMYTTITNMHCSIIARGSRTGCVCVYFVQRKTKRCARSCPAHSNKKKETGARKFVQCARFCDLGES